MDPLVIIILLVVAVLFINYIINYEKNKVFQYKLKHQIFIQAAREIFPDSKLYFEAGDTSIILESDLKNSNQRVVGKIKVIGQKMGRIYNVEVKVIILKSECTKKQSMPNNQSSIQSSINKLKDEVLSDENVKRWLKVTTF